MTKTLGFVSSAHIHFAGFANEIANSNGRARIAAIWDDNEDRGRRNAARVGAEYEAQLGDLAGRQDIDAFVLCAPNNQRLTLLERLAPTGKPVMCEKPLALTASEASACLDLVRAHKLLITTGFFRASYGVYRAAAQTLETGGLGRVTHARFRNEHDGAYRRIFDDSDVAWMVDPAVAGGGGALDMGAHAMHLLAWLFGPADSVWATISNRSGVYPDIDDFGVMQVAFRNGVTASVQAGWITIDEPGDLVIHGQQASLRARDVYDSVQAHIIGPDKQPQPLTEQPSGPKGIARLLAAMDGAIPADELGRELVAAAQAAAIIQAAYKSNDTDAWQRVETV